MGQQFLIPTKMVKTESHMFWEYYCNFGLKLAKYRVKIV